ncbi:MAG: OsmC family protein [Proteobacteria bacterium]|nr:OsmC family protein [Pseudomonadota bacterium]
MSITIKTKYLGNLRTESTHLKSESLVITDAPVDNKGKGEAFSPTDLLATSLATCMMTIMGIAANQHNLSIENLCCDVTKIMATNPRRVSEIIVEFHFAANDFDEMQKDILRDAASSCPVAFSLHSDLKKTTIFNF